MFRLQTYGCIKWSDMVSTCSSSQLRLAFMKTEAARDKDGPEKSCGKCDLLKLLLVL